MEGLRRLNELLTGYSENLTHETHTIALSLLVEVFLDWLGWFIVSYSFEIS